MLGVVGSAPSVVCRYVGDQLIDPSSLLEPVAAAIDHHIRMQPGQLRQLNLEPSQLRNQKDRLCPVKAGPGRAIRSM